jgi:hypothetical protein
VEHFSLRELCDGNLEGEWYVNSATLHKRVNDFFFVYPKATHMQVIWQDAHRAFLVQYIINIFSVLLVCVTEASRGHLVKGDGP